MRILIYGINFAPELTGIGKYTGEMAAWLAAQGHEVRVVCAPPYYPQWSVAAGYRSHCYQHETMGNIQVSRCPLWVPKRVSGLKRMLHLASFALSSLPVMLRQVCWRPQVVWMAAPALMCAPATLLTAKLSGAQSVIHIQDFEVDAAFQLGLLKQPWAKRLALWAESRLLKAFDHVSTISDAMLALAKSKGVDAQRLFFFPNWANLDQFLNVDAPQCADFRKSLGIEADQIIALYSGNMGAKQGLEILAEAARLLQDQPKLVFLFCGNGMGRASLMAQCAGLPNVKFIDFQPIALLGTLLRSADIHLLPQSAEVADLVMPSKLTGMLASGQAIVATAHPATAVAQVVASCGLVVAPEQPQLFAAAIVRLANDPALRAQLGANGQAYAQTFLDKEAILSRFDSRLSTLHLQSTD